MGSPSSAAPPDRAAPPIQLLGNSLGRSPPLLSKPPQTCPGNSHRNGVHPHQQLNASFGGHSPSFLPPPPPRPPALLLPSKEFYLGKKNIACEPHS